MPKYHLKRHDKKITDNNAIQAILKNGKAYDKTVIFRLDIEEITGKRAE